MKEFYMLMGFGAGLVTGALLYKHSHDVKKVINKSESMVKKEVDHAIDSVKDKMDDVKKSLKEKA